MEEELATYKLQLQQVEAALLGDPNNEELHKLQADLQEIIALQEELQAREAEATSQNGVVQPQVIHQWTVGERVLAPTVSGNRVFARIDSLTPAGVAITFVGTGQKTIVNEKDLQLPPENQRKNYAEDNQRAAGASNNVNKKEWMAERERRRARAQKKDARRKELENQKDSEKRSWQKFNDKASSKGLKGLKRVSATGTSQDGSSAYGVKRDTVISSRSNQFAFKSVRGAMDSLF
ncbi:unnamed protein product [Caenorhabditis auriculariae]|uniref:Tudor domain-containing protein n=1 Tax=Caenorhabditis auriculariae TaxID=2777116 RepID=A0A8S1GWH7_9PELO|nr:unnamed protein product [Caenorhabditis auriculariae]